MRSRSRWNSVRVGASASARRLPRDCAGSQAYGARSMASSRRAVLDDFAHERIWRGPHRSVAGAVDHDETNLAALGLLVDAHEVEEALRTERRCTHGQVRGADDARQAFDEGRVDKTQSL